MKLNWNAFSGIEIRVVEPGTKIVSPDGVERVVDDESVIHGSRYAYMTQTVHDALKVLATAAPGAELASQERGQ